MDKQPTTTTTTASDVTRLVQGSMRPYDDSVIAERERARRTNPRLEKLKSRMSGEVILNVLSALLGVAFLGLAASNFSLAGTFISIDSLFFTSVCLMLAALFFFTPALTLYEKGLLKNPFAAGDETPLIDEGPIHFEGSTRLFLSILGWLLGLTLIEVFLAYIEVPLQLMLTILIGLSLIKAALIMAYFMHLRFERLSLVLTLVPVLCICVCLLFVFFPDSFRSMSLRSTQIQSTTAPATTGAETSH